MSEYLCVSVSVCLYKITSGGGSGCSFYGKDVLLLWQTTVCPLDETPPGTFVCGFECTCALSIAKIMQQRCIECTQKHTQPIASV